jgi:hypothetical protein
MSALVLSRESASSAGSYIRKAMSKKRNCDGGPWWSAPTALAFRSFCMSGMQYAAVLPLPVGARARTSRFSRARGIACCWIRVGREKPRSARARRIRGEMRYANDANVSGLACSGSGSAILSCSQMTILITATANSKPVHVTCFIPQTWEYLVSSRLSGWRPLGLGNALQPGLYGAVKVRRHVRDDEERSLCVSMEVHFWGNNLRARAGAIRILQPC